MKKGFQIKVISIKSQTSIYFTIVKIMIKNHMILNKSYKINFNNNNNKLVFRMKNITQNLILILDNFNLIKIMKSILIKFKIKIKSFIKIKIK